MKWALVLSGGGAKGLAYIGMFKALEELKYPLPDCIVGCSMGAIIGGLYASGMTVDEMISFFSNDFELTDYLDVSHLGFGLTKLTKILQIGAGLNNLISHQGADSGEKSLTLFKKLSCYQTFDQLRIPFYCNATDLCEGDEVVFDKGFLADAMRASYSYPGFFAPFNHDGKLFVDGCVKNNTPVWIAKEKGFKNILAVTLGAFKTINSSDIDSSISVLTRCMEVASIKPDYRTCNTPTHILNIDTDTGSYDFSDPLYQIQMGYSVTMNHRKELLEFFQKGFFGFLNRRRMAKMTSKRLKSEKVF
ncbi:MULTISPECIES: patatin-like phospholipase family protein [unclassified Treponema]|uniref:patatin-like phospholipase family protein n=1 Tax=unclassified Treponema TaxID=2638727 RepID=UPI0020A3EA07|nr:MULTISPECIES: patatin-like phospholipase family protein [unclassified Treponema]UTC66229.1 patatin-like phospholipase family protein [Treponema sp. OMZ 789]UTC68958.1 patatin-like phospholipase family protein [Treponema sp. OMZ 790]UTC71685.1 patatin-like phospholipase family protein [Treponema sp. OMZ 791]